MRVGASVGLGSDVDEVAERVLAAVAAEFGIDVELLNSRTRRQPIATARQVAIYVLRNTTDLTLTEIGDLVGRHHATVIHAIRSIEGRRHYERDLDERMQRVWKVVARP